jgi:hypothetical protein
VQWVLNLGDGVNIFAQPLTVVVNNATAEDDLNRWLDENALVHQWTIVNDQDNPAVLQSGNYALYFRVLVEGYQNSDGHHQKALFTDKKPVIAYNGRNRYKPSRLDLADFGLSPINRKEAEGKPINILPIADFCQTVLPTQAIVTAINNIASGNVPADYSGAECSKNCDYSQVVTVEGDNAATAFSIGIDYLREILSGLTAAGKDILATDNQVVKAAVFLGDKYRENIRYPVNLSDNLAFAQAYFSENTVQLARAGQTYQNDLGLYGHGIAGENIAQQARVTTTKHYIPDLTRNEWRTGAVYLLPGVAAKIRRTDTSDRSVSIRVNMLRENTPIWTDNGYTMPKYVTSGALELQSGVEYTLSHPYGGPLYLYILANGNADEVVVEYQQVAEHPVLYVPPAGITLSEAQAFINKIASSSYAMLDIVTSNNVELHMTYSSFERTLNKHNPDTPDSYTAQDFMEWINEYDRYMIVENYAQKGILDLDNAVLSTHSQEVKDFCTKLDNRGAQNISALCSDPTIHARSKRQHINHEWQAACGASCSGNPVDTAESVVPRSGYVISHELGHNLQTRRTKIYDTASTEVSTNIYPYRSLSAWYRYKGIQDSGSYTRASMKFEEAYLAVQTSIRNGWAASAEHPIWAGGDTTEWQPGYGTETVRRAFYTQFFYIHASWDVFTKLFVLERIIDAKAKAIDEWNLYKDQLGFSNYTVEEIDSITAGDFMAIILSLINDKNHAPYFEVWGIKVSDKAKQQIQANGVTGNLPLQMYKVPNSPVNGDANPIYADIFTNVIQPENIRPLDGVSTY